MIVVAFVLSVWLACLGNAAPPFIEPCALSDSSCVKASTQKAIPGFMLGIPELGVEVLDPLELETLDYELSGLKFKLDNGRIKGWKNIVVDELSVDTDKKVIKLEFHSDFNLRGHYTAGGQLLILPIHGNGEMKLKTKDLHIKMDMPYEVVKGTDGKDRLNLEGYNSSFEVKGGAHYAMTNLFDGNKDLSNAMHNFMNENWAVVTHDFGEPVIVAAVAKVFKNAKTFLSNVPLDELIVQ